jgi:hypothetical protein
MKRRKFNPRKLLIASAGVATVNYAAAIGCNGLAGSEISTVANLMPSPGGGGNAGVYTVANLVAPPPDGMPYGGNASVANLMPPPPPSFGGSGVLPNEAGVSPPAAEDAQAPPVDAATPPTDASSLGATPDASNADL